MIAQPTDTVQQPDLIEPKTCAQCPFWQASDRTPGVGRCNQFDESTIDWEIPGDLCIVLFWNFAQTPEPAHSTAIAV